MREPVRVLVLGTGRMGSAIARLVLQKEGLELVGLVGHRPESAGLDAGTALGLGRELGFAVGVDLAALADDSRAEVAIQATRSRLEDVVDEVTGLLGRGIHVISIAEQMAWPRASSPEQAARLDALARANGVGVLGTGVNPGFVLDLLVIALTGACAHVESIRAERVNDLSPYGPAVLRAQGVGLTPDEFRKGLAGGTVVGHHGFPESLGMIAAALGWELERIEEAREPIVARERRKTEFITVEPGCVAGCRHTALGYRRGRPVITLVHPQQVHPELAGVETGDTIEIEGSPRVHLAGRPEIEGGTATAALAVNMIPRLLGAPPGLWSMAELPVPAALMGDVRTLLRERFRGDADG